MAKDGRRELEKGKEAGGKAEVKWKYDQGSFLVKHCMDWRRLVRPSRNRP